MPAPAGGIASLDAGLVGLAGLTAEGEAGLAGACAKTALQASAHDAAKIDFFIIR
jgi:3-oxoacyl-[acyl-carrier-protein] synthase III